MDYLELFNAVAKIARPVNTNKAEALSYDQNLKETGFDSLDFLLISIYLCDVFGVSEQTAKEMKPTTVKDMIEFMIKHGTKNPQTLEEAIKSIK
jgi:acyl carrier protein